MGRRNRKEGLQSSETSRVEVVIYTQEDEVLFTAQGDDRIFRGNTSRVLRFVGDSSRDPGVVDEGVISVSTHHVMGSAAPDWIVVLKSNLDVNEFETLVADDSWIDIMFTRFDITYHAVRGLVRSIEVGTTVIEGTTTVTYTLTGRGFGNIFEMEVPYFNVYASQDAAAASLSIPEQAFKERGSGIRDVPQTVEAYLRTFFEYLAKTQYGTWKLPTDMPSGGGGFFVNEFKFDSSNFIPVPFRHPLDPHHMTTEGGNLWSLASEWSDPGFCELFTDLIPNVDGPNVAVMGTQLSKPSTTRMGVILRTRPFPTGSIPGLPIDESPWFQLPIYYITPEEISSSRVVRSNAERLNTFAIVPKFSVEDLGQHQNVIAPAMNLDSVSRHGVRKIDISSNYVVDQGDLLEMVSLQRNLMVDWHCLDAYFYSGSISLGYGRPDIRIGTRLRIESPFGLSQDMTYYIEGVSHQWSFGPGIRTSLTVTRGWRGTERSLGNAVSREASYYQVINFNLTQAPARATVRNPANEVTAATPTPPATEGGDESARATPDSDLTPFSDRSLISSEEGPVP